MHGMLRRSILVCWLLALLSGAGPWYAFASYEITHRDHLRPELLEIAPGALAPNIETVTVQPEGQQLRKRIAAEKDDPLSDPGLPTAVPSEAHLLVAPPRLTGQPLPHSARIRVDAAAFYLRAAQEFP